MKTALVVDDNATNRLLAATILRKLGWTVSEADSGEQAIALFPALAPRLVLLDISMPGLSGEETCTRLRASAASSLAGWARSAKIWRKLVVLVISLDRE